MPEGQGAAVHARQGRRDAVSTLTLPGTTECQIDRNAPNDPAWVTCTAITTDEAAELAEARAPILDQLQVCLSADEWTFEGGTNVSWTRKGDLFATVFLRSNDYSGELDLAIVITGARLD